MLSCDDLRNALDEGSPKALAAVQRLESDLEHAYIDLQVLPQYVDTLARVRPFGDSELAYAALTTVCVLSRSVAVQDGSQLQAVTGIVIPWLLESGRSDPPAMECWDCMWFACPEPVGQLLIGFGLSSLELATRLYALQLLSGRFDALRGRLSFRKFTPRVVGLLLDEDANVRRTAYILLVKVFRNASEAARIDLRRSMRLHRIPDTVQDRLNDRIARELTKSQPPGQPQAPPQLPIDQAPKPGGEPLVVPTRLRPVKSVSSLAFSRRQNAPKSASSTSASSNGNISPVPAFHDPAFALQPMEPLTIDGDEALRAHIERLMPCFEDKETEFNWSDREAAIVSFRRLLRGSATTTSHGERVQSLRTLQQGLIKGILSMRTTLTSNACHAVKDAFELLRTTEGLEGFVGALYKVAIGTKRITANLAHVVICSMLVNTPLVTRYFGLLETAMADVKPQARSHAMEWLHILLQIHSSQAPAVLEARTADIERWVSKGLGDAAPSTRTAARPTFWVVNSLFPAVAKRIRTKIDPPILKSLDQSRPDSEAKPRLYHSRSSLAMRQTTPTDIRAGAESTGPVPATRMYSHELSPTSSRPSSKEQSPIDHAQKPFEAGGRTGSLQLPTEQPESSSSPAVSPAPESIPETIRVTRSGSAPHLGSDQAIAQLSNSRRSSSPNLALHDLNPDQVNDAAGGLNPTSGLGPNSGSNSVPRQTLGQVPEHEPTQTPEHLPESGQPFDPHDQHSKPYDKPFQAHDELPKASGHPEQLGQLEELPDAPPSDTPQRGSESPRSLTHSKHLTRPQETPLQMHSVLGTPGTPLPGTPMPGTPTPHGTGSRVSREPTPGEISVPSIAEDPLLETSREANVQKTQLELEKPPPKAVSDLHETPDLGGQTAGEENDGDVSMGVAEQNQLLQQEAQQEAQKEALESAVASSRSPEEAAQVLLEAMTSEPLPDSLKRLLMTLRPKQTPELIAAIEGARGVVEMDSELRVWLRRVAPPVFSPPRPPEASSRPSSTPPDISRVHITPRRPHVAMLSPLRVPQHEFDIYVDPETKPSQRWIHSGQLPALPTTAETSRLLFGQLLEKLSTHTASTEDLTLLNVFVENSKVASSDAAACLRLWTREWDRRVAPEVLEFLTRNELAEDRLVLALLLVHKLVRNRALESRLPAVVEALLVVAGRSSIPGSVEYETLPLVAAEMAAQNDPAVEEVIVRRYNPKLPSVQKVTLLRLLQGQVPSQHLMAQAVDDWDARVRKEAYPILLEVYRQNQEAGDKLSGCLSTGQQRLLAYYRENIPNLV